MKTLISSTSSFVWIPAEYLQVAIQVSVLAFGILPTLASAVLGWIQGGADKMTDADFGRITVWTRAGRAISKVFDTLAIRFAMGFEVVGEKLSKNASEPSVEVTTVDGHFTPSDKGKRWPELSREDVAFIQVASRKAIQDKYGTSNGTAGNWKADIKSGKMPWQDAKKLTESVEK